MTVGGEDGVDSESEGKLEVDVGEVQVVVRPRKIKKRKRGGVFGAGQMERKREDTEKGSKDGVKTEKRGDFCNAEKEKALWNREELWDHFALIPN